MKTLHLHIGSPKTGTTFLQQVLFRNKARIEQRNFCYPGNESSHQKVYFTTNCTRKNWPRQYRGADANDVEKVVRSYLASLEKDILDSECEEYIMSTEDLFISNRKYIRNLLTYLNNFFSVVKVYIFLRDPVEYYRSYQQELIKARSYVTSPYSFEYPIKKVVTAWQNFCETTVIDYQPDKDSLEVLAGEVGISTDNFLKNEASNNSSTSIEQIALLEKIQRHLYADSDNILKVHLKAIPQINPSFTTKAELQQWVKSVVYENHQKDLKWLSNEYGISFLDKQYLQTEKPSSEILKGDQVRVSDIYTVKGKSKIKRYEALVVDALLKKVFSN